MKNGHLTTFFSGNVLNLLRLPNSRASANIISCLVESLLRWLRQLYSEGNVLFIDSWRKMTDFIN